jgi:diguanylate cyclase (GGDEF)-like protein
MENVLKILILEDTRGDADQWTAVLKKAGIACTPLRTEARPDFISQLDRLCPDAVLWGRSPFSTNEWAHLAELRKARPDVPVVVVSRSTDVEEAMTAMKSGAVDFVPKSNLARLPDAVSRAVEDSRNRQRIARVTRAQAVRAATASAIVRNPETEKLFEAACRIAVEHGAFRLAWMGLVTPEASTLKPVVWSGHNEGYLERVAGLSVRVDPDECRGKGEAFRRFGSIVVNDIQAEPSFLLREEALARGYRSMIALPLISGHRVHAVFKIYASEPNCFFPDERKVLGEIAGDLSFALDQRAREERLCRLAYHDPLTGLANRRLLYEHVKQEFARAHREKTSVAVVFVDLDNFKSVNDSLGHSAGDRLLEEVSSRIVSCTRECDIVARFGGDEFVMVLPIRSDPEVVSSIVERVVESVSRSMRIMHRRIAVSCSIGVAVYPEDGKDFATLLGKADAAMYQAKNPDQSVPRAKVVRIRSAAGAR